MCCSAEIRGQSQAGVTLKAADHLSGSAQDTQYMTGMHKRHKTFCSPTAAPNQKCNLPSSITLSCLKLCAMKSCLLERYSM